MKTGCYKNIIDEVASARPGVLELMDAAIADPRLKVMMCVLCIVCVLCVCVVLCLCVCVCVCVAVTEEGRSVCGNGRREERGMR